MASCINSKFALPTITYVEVKKAGFNYEVGLSLVEKNGAAVFAEVSKSQGGVRAPGDQRAVRPWVVERHVHNEGHRRQVPGHVLGRPLAAGRAVRGEEVPFGGAGGVGGSGLTAGHHVLDARRHHRRQGRGGGRALLRLANIRRGCLPIGG